MLGLPALEEAWGWASTVLDLGEAEPTLHTQVAGTACLMVIHQPFPANRCCLNQKSGENGKGVGDVPSRKTWNLLTIPRTHPCQHCSRPRLPSAPGCAMGSAVPSLPSAPGPLLGLLTGQQLSVGVCPLLRSPFLWDHLLCPPCETLNPKDPRTHRRSIPSPKISNAPKSDIL